MNKLIISLTGNITKSNFEEWKKELLNQIAGIQKELKNDGDFVLATDQAKSLKQAETALKQAKESAIEQALKSSGCSQRLMRYQQPRAVPDSTWKDRSRLGSRRLRAKLSSLEFAK